MFVPSDAVSTKLRKAGIGPISIDPSALPLGSVKTKGPPVQVTVHPARPVTLTDPAMSESPSDRLVSHCTSQLSPTGWLAAGVVVKNRMILSTGVWVTVTW